MVAQFAGDANINPRADPRFKTAVEDMRDPSNCRAISIK